MPVVGIYLKDFPALPGAVAEENIIPIAVAGNQISYATTVGGIITNARVTGKLLTGLSVTGSAILATDTILQAFGKVQNQLNGKQGTITLTTTGSSGAATLIANTLNIPQYTDSFVGTVTSVAALTLGTTGTDLSSTVANGTTTPVITLNVPTASATNRGVLSSTDFSAFTAKQNAITLTTTGSSGAATLVGATLNIPNYSTDLSGYVPYTGATGAVNLGAFDLTVNSIQIGRGAGSIAFNTRVGTSALNSNTTGTENTSIGYSTLLNNTIGGSNSVFGYGSMSSNTIGTSNVAIGATTLALNISGSTNIAIGNQAGNYSHTPTTNNESSSNSIYLGYDSRSSANGNTNEIVIGHQGRGNGSNTVTIGNSSVTNNYFSGNIRGGAFIKSGGTSAQILAADGSVITAGTNITISGGVISASGGGGGGGTVTSVAALTLGTSGTDLSSTVANSTTTPVITLNVPTASATNRGALSSTDWSTFNSKQGAITLTTTGTSGAATLIGNTLNIPQYSGGGGTITLSAIGSTPNANGATITSSVLNLEPASASFGGVVTTLAQTFAGDKTLTGALIGTTGSFTSSGGSDTFSISHSSGSGIALNITKGGNGEGIYVNKTSGTGNAVTIIGTLNATTLVKSGGTSAQFLKADGTVDSTAYGTGSVTSVAALTLGTTGTDLSSTVANGTTTPVITLNVPTASATNRGALSSADWSTFNSKEPALTKGNLTEATSSVLTITGGTGSVIGSGTSIQVKQSSSTISGFLSSTDWSTFNGKQDTITLTTTGSSGPATLVGATLNIPNYAGGGNARNQTTFTATAAQTTFTVTYIVGQVDVYYNGSKLAPAEFTATNGTSIILATACQVNDIVDVIAYLTSVANGTTTNLLTFSDSGAGDASGSTFNGSAAKTISFNSVGANKVITSGTAAPTGGIDGDIYLQYI